MVVRNNDIIKNVLDSFITDNTVIKGHRSLYDGLYHVPFPELKSNYAVTRDKNKLKLAQFLHGCAFLPAISTFQTCINKGNFIMWPGIENVKCKTLLGNPLGMALGHLDQERQNLQFTKEADRNEDAFPAQEKGKSLQCYYAIVTTPSTSKTYID